MRSESLIKEHKDSVFLNKKSSGNLPINSGITFKCTDCILKIVMVANLYVLLQLNIKHTSN